MIHLAKKLGVSARQLTSVCDRHPVAAEALAELETLLSKGGEPVAAPTIVGPPASMMRLRGVLAVVGVSRSTLFRLIAAGEFPRPVALSERTRAWPSSEVEKWIAERSARGAA